MGTYTISNSTETFLMLGSIMTMVNIILLVIGGVKKKLTVSNIVLIIALSLAGPPIIGFIVGVSIHGLLGLAIGFLFSLFVYAGWLVLLFIYLIYKLNSKPKKGAQLDSNDTLIDEEIE